MTEADKPGDDVLTAPPARIASRLRFAATITADFDDAALVADWHALTATGQTTVFQARGWLRHVLNSLKGDKRSDPLFVTIREQDSGRLVALFALVRIIRSGLGTIAFLGQDVCDTNAPLLTDGIAFDAATASALIDTLCAALPPVSLIRFTRMPAVIGAIPNPFTLVDRIRGSQDSTFPLDLDPASPTAVTQTSAYKAYQKQWRKLSRRDGITVVDLTSDAEIMAAFDHMIHLRKARFDTLKRDDQLRDAALTALYRAAALAPTETRIARLAALTVGDRPVAYIYRLDDGSRFSTVISAIEDGIGNAYAPALILFTKIFEQAVARRYRYGDLGLGAMHYKTRFAPAANPLLVWEHALDRRGKALLALEAGQRRMRDWAREQPLMRRLVRRLRGEREAAAPSAKPEPGAVDTD